MCIKNKQTLINSNNHYVVVTPPPPPPRKCKLSLKTFYRPKTLFPLFLIFLFFLLSGCPQSMTTYVDVPIYITNTDTNTPMITNHHFVVAESVGIGSVIGTVKASDDIATIYYVITTGDPNYIFSINTNGEFRNIMRLDHDTASNYNLTVRVSDAAGNASNATITVAVTDVDASPSVTTITASGIENNNVILNGNLTRLGTNTDGSERVNEYGFIYSTNASNSGSLQLGKNGVEKIAGDSIASTGSYSHVIANLSPATIHYFRAFALNDGGTNYGEVSNFSTTYHQTFALSGATDGIQSNTIYANSTHTYNVPLSNTLMYSLTVKANSSISNNVTIYEGNNTEPLYIRAAPFTNSLETDIIFSGVNNGSRYLVLPLAPNSHRVVLSNNSDQNQSYSLNLEEYSVISRLLLEPQKMSFYDLTNANYYFLVHVPPNKNMEVSVDKRRGSNSIIRTIVNGLSASFNTATLLDITRPLSTSSTESKYHVLLIDDPSGNNSHTNYRLIFRFVDP